MSNHIHLIWQMLGNHEKKNVQRDFLKYTGQQILNELHEKNSPLIKELFVGAKDRKYQVWERNALSISLESDHFSFRNWSIFINLLPRGYVAIRKIAIIQVHDSISKMSWVLIFLYITVGKHPATFSVLVGGAAHMQPTTPTRTKYFLTCRAVADPSEEGSVLSESLS